VDVPAALERAVNAACDRAEAWAALTPGKRRMLAHHVGSAKTEQTRARRTDEAIDALMNWRGDLHARTKARR
ncbi:MAG: YdeI/OmpD-associated family protein, partial [Pseudomonadota bacterium]